MVDKYARYVRVFDRLLARTPCYQCAVLDAKQSHAPLDCLYPLDLIETCQIDRYDDNTREIFDTEDGRPQTSDGEVTETPLPVGAHLHAGRTGP